MQLFKEIALLPELLDPAHHDSPAMQRQVLAYILQGLADGGFVRSLRDGAWLQAAIASAGGSKAAAEFLKMLTLRKLLLAAPSCRAPSWFHEAVFSHKHRPLAGIVVDDLSEPPPAEVPVASVSTLLDAHWWLETPPSINIFPTAAELTRVLSVLLAAAREIHIIDPYLMQPDIVKPDTTPYIPTLEAFIRASVLNPSRPETTYHTSLKAFATLAAAKAAFAPVSARLAHHGLRGRVCLWDPRQVSGKFHDRYFVTDIGGCQVGTGFASSASRATTVSLLSDEGRRDLLRRRFNPDPNCSPALLNVFRIGAIPAL